MPNNFTYVCNNKIISLLRNKTALEHLNKDKCKVILISIDLYEEKRLNTATTKGMANITAAVLGQQFLTFTGE